MDHLLGQLIGGTVALYLLTRLILLALRQSRFKYRTVTIAAVMALALATVLAGYGMADGGDPVFATAFRTYLIPAIIVLAIDLVRIARRRPDLASGSS